MPLSALPIKRIDVTTYTLRTDAPEADGTFAWGRSIMAFVEVDAGGKKGIGYTYADESTAHFIANHLAPAIVGRDAMSINECFEAMVKAVRNLGRPGIASTAISAVDIALWDLKAKLLDLPLVTLLGAARPAIPICGSGGFTSYSIDLLCEQLGGWVSQGMQMVQMKVGRDPEADAVRVRAVRAAIGDAQLFVDADGAYCRKQALVQSERFAESNVAWFEEPVPSDDLEGLRLLRDRAPACMEIAAGEYGYDPSYFQRLLAASAVDVLQADVTRCGGITGFLRVAALCEAHHVPLAAHRAPAITLHVACAVPMLRHLEYFHDHVRFEHRMFSGIPLPIGGMLAPDLTQPGLGLSLKPSADAIDLPPADAFAH